MQRAIRLVICALFICLTVNSYGQTNHRVVIQLSSADTAAWRGVIKNIMNLQKTWSKELSIEVVAHGPGISFLLTGKTTQMEAIKKLKAEGVTFMACENTLRDRNIDKAQVLPEAGYVPSGVAEVVVKQEEGWSYLKGGF